MALRLKKTHPTYEKIDKLFGFMQELKLEVYRSYEGVHIKDVETGVLVKLLDNDDNAPVQDLPPFMEFKLIIIED